MILRPLDNVPPAARSSVEPVPVWPAIAEQQRLDAKSFWLISQPDHARLSGELAASFLSPEFPRVDPLLARAIGVHDAGWAIFEAEARDAAAPALTAQGRPRSFIEFAPPEFLCAWTRSIESVERICPAGGIIVSRHFCALGEFRVHNSPLQESDSRLIEGFLKGERQRQDRLLSDCEYTAPDLEALLEVLQFCDLLSLYLCSGCGQAVEFPNRLAASPVRILPLKSEMDGENSFRLTPSPFQLSQQDEHTVSLGVTARFFAKNGGPVNGEPKLTTLAFRLI